MISFHLLHTCSFFPKVFALLFYSLWFFSLLVQKQCLVGLSFPNRFFNIPAFHSGHCSFQSTDILEVCNHILSICGSEVVLQWFFISFLKENWRHSSKLEILKSCTLLCPIPFVKFQDTETSIKTIFKHYIFWKRNFFLRCHYISIWKTIKWYPR